MGTADEIRDAAIENAKGPKRVQGDEGTVEQHSIKDQLAAAEAAANSSAASQPHRGLRFTRAIPAGPGPQ